MNHCRDCNSDYASPGTCNCFAVGGKRYVAPVAPYTPWWVYPYTWTPCVPTPTYPIWGGGTISVGDLPNGTATITFNNVDTNSGSFACAGGKC